MTTRASIAVLALALTLGPAVAAATTICMEPGASGLRCNDGDRCTRADVCDAGLCIGEPTDCADDDVCNGEETCDPATGACRAGTPPVCDDGDPCTVDEPCDPAGGCVIRRLPDVDFVRCRAAGRLPLVACSDLLPRRVRRPLLRMQRILDRAGPVTSERERARTMARLRRACGRAKERLDAALADDAADACLVQQRRALDDVCPARQVTRTTESAASARVA